MNYKNLIPKKYLSKNVNSKYNDNYKFINSKIKYDILSSDQTLNILSKNYKFNFRLNELKKFKKFKTIAVIGMGGSILGAEAIQCFFKKKIKKKLLFL